jgi:hypothetical protein
MDDLRAIINSRDMDRSILIGREIKIRSEQFPGRMLTSRIVGFSGDNLVIDRSGSSGLIDQLIGHQNIEVSLIYKGQPVVFQSVILKPREGRIQIPLASRVVPQLRRQFIRYDLHQKVRLTYFDDASLSMARLNRLKWLETGTINMCGGGMLVELPTLLSAFNFVLVHLDLEGFSTPGLLVGRICHGYQAESKNCFVGIEFIIKEKRLDKIPSGLIRNLPARVFDFDGETRRKLSLYLTEKYGKR